MTENRKMGIGEDQRLCLVTTEFIPIIIIYGGTLQPLITCTKTWIIFHLHFKATAANLIPFKWMNF